MSAPLATSAISGDPRPLAPVRYLGFQPGYGDVAGFECYNLLEAIEGHPCGSR